MPATAKKHFDEDIARANAILGQAHGMPHSTPEEKLVKEDLFRCSLMYGVGAVDAYFCDAYADLIARTLRAKTLQGNIAIPNGIQNIVLPVSALFSNQTQRDNWKWRMAARGIVEKDNVLSLSKIQTLFNPFFRKGNKLFDLTVINSLIISHNAPNRVTGITRTEYRRKKGKSLDGAIRSIRKKINEKAGCRNRKTVNTFIAGAWYIRVTGGISTRILFYCELIMVKGRGNQVINRTRFFRK